MMATKAHEVDASMDKKSARLDFRLSAKKRSLYVRAAALKGLSLTGWALNNLDECAQRDIRSETETVLSAQQFDEFAAALEQPMPEAMLKLLAVKPEWT
jgi:uncharacterized protein (DUF1778 family)